MRLLKAIYETIKCALVPTCNHDAGVCLRGQGRECKGIINKNGVEIERKNLRIGKK